MPKPGPFLSAIPWDKFKVWVLAPCLETSDANIDYYYDFTQSIAEYTNVFAGLKANWQWQPVTMQDYKRVIFSIASSANGVQPLIINLCDGDEVNGVPGVSVIHELEKYNLVYTGSDAHFYEITTSKIPMKQAFDNAKVPTAPWEAIIAKDQDVSGIFERLGCPIILKPSVSGGSMGVGIKNVVHNETELCELIQQMFAGYRGWQLTTDGLIAEAFITGPEYTTLIVGSHDKPQDAGIYSPVERIFHPSLPETEKFLSFDRLWEIYEEESPMPNEGNFYEYESPDSKLIDELKKISWDAYVATGGKGYTRVDLRMDKTTGKIFVLEVNAQCGLSEDEDFTSIGAILRLSGKTFTQLVVGIINDALSRHGVSVRRGQSLNENLYVLPNARKLRAKKQMSKALKICVLQPDYSTSAVDYQYYDPPRNLCHLMPEADFDHIFLNKLTTYKQLKELKKKKYDIFVNLCEGYLEWEVPSIDVIYSMELLNLPFTGPTSLLYDPPKELMKYVAYCADVKTPAYALIDTIETLEADCRHLKFPLFVKPAKAGDSLGVDEHSLVHNIAELKEKVHAIIDEYGPLLVEEYIEGREFTVMLAANPDGKTATAFRPVEYIFPKGTPFKTYALKTSELHPNANIPVTDACIDKQLRSAAQNIFAGFNGVGYGRLDFRMNDKGELYFLEINFTCSVFYTDGYEGSADYILKHDGTGQAAFLNQIIMEGIGRYNRKQKLYTLKGNSIAGYGIYANRPIAANQVIFKGEEGSQRMVTQRHVEENWDDKEKETFRKYAYPISDEVFLLWDNDPSGWAPQNHSCEPNTAYEGLNVIALRNISKGEELTLDYASFLDEHMEPFQCQCGTSNCRGTITGIPHNSVTEREKGITV